jgi:phosphatidylglycerol lysyltransferase
MRSLGRLGRPLYDFAGLHAFKAKLAPSRWEPVYVTCPRGVPPALAVLDALRAFAGGSLAAFALRTLLSGPALLMWIRALLLWPWTALLAIVPTAPWFPSAFVHWAWVAFDVFLCIAFTELCREFRPRFAHVLAWAITIDALVTLVQVGAWNAPRTNGVLEALVLAAACAAPIVAAALLWTRLARSDGGRLGSVRSP